MRHRKKFNHLSRKAGHRRALMANMASSLILHKRIKTTTAKAKALRTYVEPLITKTKDLTTVEEKIHAQRVVFGHLQNKHAVKELFGDVATKVESRPGGYTRILKIGNRPGDNADMCFIELVDYNENMLSTKEAKKTSTRRSRRGGKKKSGDTATAQSTEEGTQTAEAEAPSEGNENQAQPAEAEVVESEVKGEATAEETTSAEEQKEEEKETTAQQEKTTASAEEKEDQGTEEEKGSEEDDDKENKEDKPKE